ncbi:hypothetical protein NIES2100_07420 [Calothrix sp. NIES-2100]|uniref:hypothetical protein n=1 Tax=Calothrix sp. NIES-2100 TaxID=1954172 RepID=UPI000B606472|nr:hypothetical protein NIES2100_07420 [Calothrix sp. NIES-2100]
MPNPKGNPESLQPIQSDREKPLTTTLSFRCTEEMKEEVKAKEDPPEFCRRAIQEALEKDKSNQSDT